MVWRLSVVVGRLTVGQQSQAAQFCPSARIYVGISTTTNWLRRNGSMIFPDLSYGLTGTIPASLGSMVYLQVLA